MGTTTAVPWAVPPHVYLFTVLMGVAKEILFKIHYFHVLSKPIKQKFHEDFKNYLKKSHTISEGSKVFDWTFWVNDHTILKLYGKTGLNLIRYQKQYRPLRRLET